MQKTNPDVLIVRSGEVNFTSFALPSSLKAVIVVVDPEDSHLDWTSNFNEQLGSHIVIRTWNDLVSEKSDESLAPAELSEKKFDDNSNCRRAIITTYNDKDGEVQMVEFSTRVGFVIFSIAYESF